MLMMPEMPMGFCLSEKWAQCNLPLMRTLLMMAMTLMTKTTLPMMNSSETPNKSSHMTFSISD